MATRGRIPASTYTDISEEMKEPSSEMIAIQGLEKSCGIYRTYLGPNGTQPRPYDNIAQDITQEPHEYGQEVDPGAGAGSTI